MAAFDTQDKMYQVLGGLFEEMFKDQDIVQKMQVSELTICFQLKEPEGKIWLTNDGKVLYGEQSTKPSVTMILSGDTCHQFWLRKVSMPLALAKGHIKAKGPMNKVLKLLPVLKPAYDMYPERAAQYSIVI